MIHLLGLLLVSFGVTSFFMVPFIDLLFYFKKRYERVSPRPKVSKTPIHDLLMKEDESTPSGGGILLIVVLVLISVFYAIYTQAEISDSLKIILFTAVSFGFLGIFDDIKLLVTKRRGKFLGLGTKILLLAQTIFAFIIAYFLYSSLGLNNIYVTGLGNFIIDWWYIPLAAFTIVSFSNAYNISDGLDGLSTGLLVICLFALLALASTSLNITLASFIGIWIGILFAYLYFNIYPARIYLGDAGAFAFGATLAVVGLLTGKILGLAVIGGVYVVIVSSSLLQIFAKKILGRKIFPVAPIHMYFKYIGWAEPKIVFRFWLAGAMFAILGLWMSLLSN